LSFKATHKNPLKFQQKGVGKTPLTPDFCILGASMLIRKKTEEPERSQNNENKTYTEIPKNS